MLSRFQINTQRFNAVLLCVCLGAVALGNLRQFVQTCQLPTVYEKDFLSGYLLAQAMRNGVDPYLPIPELAQTYLGLQVGNHLNHPTPHPFGVGWLALPFALFGYQRGASLWGIFSIICLLYSLGRILQIIALPVRWVTLALGLLWVAWTPVAHDLYLGQLNLWLLALLVTGWWALRRQREWQGGGWIGLALVLKLTGWPILLWLLWQRRWRPLVAAGSVFVGAHLLAGLLHGWSMLIRYYTVIAPQLKKYYAGYDTNYSLWTFGSRLFADFGHNFLTIPLVHSPALAQVVSLAVVALALGAGIWLAQRARAFDCGFAVMLGVGTLLNPIAWHYYFVLLLPAIMCLGQQLHQLAWPARPTLLACFWLGALQFSSGSYFWLATQGAVAVNGQGQSIVPALWGLLSLFPALVVFALLFQLSAFTLRRQPISPLVPAC